MNHAHSPIIVALDTSDVATAGRWIEATRESVSVFKVGLEFFLNFGAAGIATLKELGDFQLFLDLKLHDIPNTVAGAVRAIEPLHPKFLTVHAAGGSAMISAAAAASPQIDITAVTILTSLTQEALHEMGLNGSPLEFATSFATNAVKAGARAIVCSPHEVHAIRALVPGDVSLITPGVRPAYSDIGDQARVMTPAEAIAAGSDYLVIGRPITGLYDGSEASLSRMGDAAKSILDSIS